MKLMKLAWSLEPRGIGTAIVDADGDRVAVVDEEDRAAFIVRAVNSYEGLIEVIRAVRDGTMEGKDWREIEGLLDD